MIQFWSTCPYFITVVTLYCDDFKINRILLGVDQTSDSTMYGYKYSLKSNSELVRTNNKTVKNNKQFFIMFKFKLLVNKQILIMCNCIFLQT